MNALATIRSAPGLESYLEALEERLEAAVASHPGLLAEVGGETLAAGGKRLRPVLVYLASPTKLRATPRVIFSGAAVELVHMATLVHDDMLDGADLRRGRPTAWAAYGRETAKAAGDYLFACAFVELARTGDASAVALLADAALALVRGEALQRRQAFRPETTVEEYLARCSLKTGKLFEAACLLGGGHAGLASFGLALGIAFQIADDILDCSGEFDTTGKAPGVDLRDGTPTLPLILAARVDEAVWRALAGDVARDRPSEGSPAARPPMGSTTGEATSIADALERVGASGALEAARELALEYACQARAALDGEPDRLALEALTYAVVDRQQ